MNIEILHIDFHYDRIYDKISEETGEIQHQQIFKDFSYTITEGDIHCVMGASGCGKTTLLKLLTGQLIPESGSIKGMEHRHISMVFQENRLCEDFSAETNIKLGCGRGYFGSYTEADIKKHLAEVGLGDAMGKKVSELSGGMKRRVSIVRAMLSESDMLLMDEPLKGLDETTKREVLAYIKRYRGNRTMLVVTHDRKEMENFGGNLLQLS